MTQPPTLPFEVLLENDGRSTLVQAPEDEAGMNAVVNAIIQTQPFGDGWVGEYRTLHALSGGASEPLRTLADVQAISVPHWRRIKGELRGTQMTILERGVSDDGQDWQPYPETVDVQEEAKHPAFSITGAPVERFNAVQWREGRIDLEPDPPEEVLELLEYVVQMFNGTAVLNGTEGGWATRHEQFGGDPKKVPVAKRATFEVRQLAPLFSPSEPPFARQSNLEFWPLLPLEYSLDGKKWAAYPIAGEPEQAAQDDSEDTDNDPMSLLSQLFDMQTATATVNAGGEVEWDEGAIPEQHAESLRGHIREATGAGQPELWAERTGALLPEGVNGTPKAVRVQVMKALLDSAPSMMAQSFAPVALTVDGTTWHDLAPDLEFDDEDEE